MVPPWSPPIEARATTWPGCKPYKATMPLLALIPQQEVLSTHHSHLDDTFTSGPFLSYPLKVGFLFLFLFRSPPLFNLYQLFIFPYFSS